MKLELHMDEKRNLTVVDETGIVYDFWALGWGTPVSFVIETKEEAEEKKQKEDAKRIKESIDYALERKLERAKPWYKKIF